MRCRLPVRRVPRLPRRGSGDGVPFPLGRFTWARAGPSGRPGEMLAVSSGVSEELVITWDVCGGARSGDPLCPAGVTLIVTEALLWSPLLPALGGEGPCPQAEQAPAPARASGPPGAGLAPVGACVQRPGPPPSPHAGGSGYGSSGRPPAWFPPHAPGACVVGLLCRVAGLWSEVRVGCSAWPPAGGARACWGAVSRRRHVTGDRAGAGPVEPPVLSRSRRLQAALTQVGACCRPCLVRPEPRPPAGWQPGRPRARPGMPTQECTRRRAQR